MKKPKGISISIGFSKKPIMITSLPLRTIRPQNSPKWFGFRLDLIFGTLRRPIPNIFKREFYLFNASDPGDPNYVRKESEINPWNSGNHWFVLTIPYCPGIFLSAFIYKPGFYLGTKTYEVNRISSQLLDYKTQKYQYDENGKPIYTWASEEEQGNIYLCPSGSLRSDLMSH
jgi:hypothetical protein